MTGTGTTPLDLCGECGHPRRLHIIDRLVGTYLTPFHGRCTATVDTRHPATGGDTLTPCRCEKWLARSEDIRA